MGNGEAGIGMTWGLKIKESRLLSVFVGLDRRIKVWLGLSSVGS